MPILGLFGATPVVCHAMKKRGPLPPVEVDPDATDRLPAPDFASEDPEATGSWAEGDRPGSSEEDELTCEVHELSADAPAAATIDDAFAELNRVLREQSATIARLEGELGTAAPAEAPVAPAGSEERSLLEEQLRRAERKCLDLAVQLDEHRAAFAKMEDELGVAREAAEAAQRQRELVERARQLADEEREHLQSALAAAEAARQEAVARADEVSVELAALSRAPAAETLEQERQHLKDRVAELRNAVAEIARERDALRKRVDSGGGELRDLRTELAARGQWIETLLERLRTAEGLRRLRSDFRAAERLRHVGRDPRVAELEHALAAERAARSRAEEVLAALRAQQAVVINEGGAVSPSASMPAPQEPQPQIAAAPATGASARADGVMDEDPAALRWRLSLLVTELTRREERVTVLEDELRRQNRVLDRIRGGLGLGLHGDLGPEPAQPAAPVVEARREPPRLRRYLTRLDGNNSVVHVISQPRISIGRSSKNDVQIRETYVSRHHATILIGPENAIVEDAGSSNGVFLNERRVRRELLQDGDIVAFGKARFRFQVRRPEHEPD